MENVIQVNNETTAQCERITKDGRKITYKLQVIQQPERARACGSGAKSSADRRPVDPPPIVELKIFEGEHAENDITFQMNANYFLFATLEQARHLAHGRVPHDPSRLTVLTGTPVAGLVYLDRPTAAGYFLFPDLSVRHEGKYRLSFNLYEELKEQRDEDKISDEDKEAPGIGPAHVTHRLEVKSQPFMVFSAKKFPGLATSTDLSRLVAEQGCRVRIRRDVRMRKRDKNGKEIYDEDPMGGEMYTAPNGEPMRRQRSSSAASLQSLAPSPGRRASEQDATHAYHQHGHAGAAPGQNMYYGHPPAPQYGYPQYPAPQYSQQPMMAPPPPQQQPMHYGQPQQVQQPPPPPPPPSAGYYAYPQAPPQQAQVQAPTQPTYEQQYHMRSSISEPRPQSPNEQQRTWVAPPPSGYTYQPGQPRQIQAPVQPSYQNPQMPSTPTYQGEQARYAQSHYAQEPTRSLPASHKMLPALNTNQHQVPNRLLEPSSPNSGGPSPSYPEATRSFRSYGGPEHGTAGKRSFGDVFDTHHLNGPMRSGARPSVGHAGHMLVDHDDASEELSLAKLRMSYKRADGRAVVKNI
ncbi:hypothetical protein CAC42_1216 [Sphaceloma murrayae]|uniref:Velvet domain-containing protein n=1 Tax=Sphaceloma murrayae TaxID=2082308 RepID=A0A2K1R2C6_9PEZI|nr:hypothetical protein CAC42_1216 [Sphaceloma murrayae]